MNKYSFFSKLLCIFTPFDWKSISLKLFHRCLKAPTANHFRLTWHPLADDMYKHVINHTTYFFLQSCVYPSVRLSVIYPPPCFVFGQTFFLGTFLGKHPPLPASKPLPRCQCKTWHKQRLMAGWNCTTKGTTIRWNRAHSDKYISLSGVGGPISL